MMQSVKVFSFLAALCVLSPLSSLPVEAQDYRSSDRFSSRYSSFSDALSAQGSKMARGYNHSIMNQAEVQSYMSVPSEMSDPLMGPAIMKSQQQSSQNQQSGYATNGYGLPNYGLPNYGLGGTIFDNPFFSSQGAGLFDK